ncbi:tail fiber domain-containing protein [Hymenobacter edaphi]|uniref:tail fiber domain-containing protein n=1 Tax=Hymenobacter edaphi TaxID=2211146 RepID=UPI001402EA48|nr:tail fiber domain-containing protein [Hymenobacter edaphi]
MVVISCRGVRAKISGRTRHCICQNPGYDGTGSAIRIVDGTQGAGKVLTSNAQGYGTCRPVPAPTAAGGNFNLGAYYLVGNGGSTGPSLTSTGRVGIGLITPFGQLGNSSDNMPGSDVAGGNPGSLNWQANQQGYAAMVFNDGTVGNSGALALQVANNTTAGALDVSRGDDATTTVGTSLFRVNGNGRVGIGTNNPGAPLEVSALPTYGTTNYAYGCLLSNGRTNTFSGPLTNTSIKAAGRVVTSEFNALSGARLKRVLGLSNAAQGLARLQRLRITDYQMRERVQFGDQSFKKVIAQEVEAVYPQAVTRQRGFLPGIYARATAPPCCPPTRCCSPCPPAAHGRYRRPAVAPHRSSGRSGSRPGPSRRRRQPAAHAAPRPAAGGPAGIRVWAGAPGRARRRLRGAEQAERIGHPGAGPAGGRAATPKRLAAAADATPGHPNGGAEPAPADPGKAAGRQGRSAVVPGAQATSPGQKRPVAAATGLFCCGCGLLRCRCWRRCCH